MSEAEFVDFVGNLIASIYQMGLTNAEVTAALVNERREALAAAEQRGREAEKEENARLREASKDALASLVAAISLLSRGSKKAAPSDKMFDQMLIDYGASVRRVRAALGKDRP